MTPELLYQELHWLASAGHALQAGNGCTQLQASAPWTTLLYQSLPNLWASWPFSLALHCQQRLRYPFSSPVLNYFHILCAVCAQHQ